MRFLYNFSIVVLQLVLPIAAIFSKKLQLFVQGRKETFSKLEGLKNQETIWFHAASLGEFEQAIPIIEQLKKEKKTSKILVTFFSPSGYEVRKNYPLADVVCYLPLDTSRNAKKLIEIVNPTVAIFIKYEFWPNFLKELEINNTPTILVSGIFREKQLFFKWYGQFMKNSLTTFHHFFVQNTKSKELLAQIGFNNTTVAGDTRFDRVYEIVNQNNQLKYIETFKNNQYTIVAGSTWPEDEALFLDYINTELKINEKVIIAPHNINLESIKEFEKKIDKKVVLFSEKENKDLKDFQVFILDTIGVLTKVYAVADVAYVGGGLKTGLHNILEPATFGIPVVIGNRFEKFQEAIDLVAQKGCFAIRNQNEFSSIFVTLREDELLRKQTGEINKNYIKSRLGATEEITNYLKLKI